MKRVFSGIQPSGIMHIGNYLGAIKQWVPLQNDHECIFSIVDLHAITAPQDPKVLSKNIIRAAATYLACGIDPNKSKIFIQSHRPEHSELAWIINTFSNFGEMRRMTQFKTIASKFSSDNVPLGIFTYPTLMAADILLYQTDIVPVGEDQKQHVELTRNLAQRFNNKFDNVFTIPEPRLNNEGARIMGLDDPTKKMSKSALSPNNYIALTDDADTIKRKIAKAVTDSGNEIKVGDTKPAMTNLLTIFSLFSETPIHELEEKYKNSSYSDFKNDLAQVIVDKITPIGYKISEIEQDPKALLALLDKGAQSLAPLAKVTLRKVREHIGLV
jgi:tryptophanyl-tRNA synthetase